MMHSLDHGIPPGSWNQLKRPHSMKTNLPVRSPVTSLSVALFGTGLRVREEYDELILNQHDFSLSIHTAEKPGGTTVHCCIMVAERGFEPGSLGLFSEMAMEGYPVVGVGACAGRISCEFSWFHPDGVDWRISAERCQGLVDRVVGARLPVGEALESRAGRRRTPRLRAAA